ncbi:MAG: ribosomal protein S18-alanine N-acetyltransferase [Thioalkalivibrionaceae bacterium]
MLARDPALPYRHAAPGGLTLRAMQLVDIEALMPTEEAAYLFPWTRGIFCDCLRVGYDGWVVEDPNGALIGHAMLSYGADEGHLLNLTVAPFAQGRGVGRWMLRRLLSSAAERGAKRLFLEVRPSNHAALVLYASEGFERIGVRPRYYPAIDDREDAWVYVRDCADLDQA